MTIGEFNELLEGDMQVFPDKFSKLTITETKKLTCLFKQVQTISKTNENRKMQKFEQMLRTKPRKLLLLDLGSCT